MRVGGLAGREGRGSGQGRPGAAQALALPLLASCRGPERASTEAYPRHAYTCVPAGCEIGVASTKAYTSQIAVITMMALALRWVWVWVGG